MKIAIIGGGASGLACACELIRLARKNGLKPEVCIFEKNDRVGKKLLSTGNGRCNMLNLHASAEDYYEAAPFVSHALEKFPAKSNITFFETLGLYTHADEEGRVYPLSNQASGVLDVLRFYCEKAGVKIYTSTPVQKIEKRADKFVINVIGSVACNSFKMKFQTLPELFQLFCNLNRVNPVYFQFV